MWRLYWYNQSEEQSFQPLNGTLVVGVAVVGGAAGLGGNGASRIEAGQPETAMPVIRLACE